MFIVKRKNVPIYKLEQRCWGKNLFYPIRDNKPIGETDWHIQQVLYCIEALRGFFYAWPDAYVSGNNFLYFEQGNPKAVVSPDCYVVPGVPMRLRDSYMTWKESGKLPSFVLEITSKQTRLEDTLKKFSLYERTLCVPEYFLFDPLEDYLKPRLQAYRLIKGRYARVLPVEDRIHSEQLNLDLVVTSAFLRFYDPVSQQTLPTYAELHNRSLQKRDEQESDRTNVVEAELVQVRAQATELRRQIEEATSLQHNRSTLNDN